MKRLRRPTVVEWITIVGVSAILAAVLLIPDTATSTRRQIERRARDFEAGSVDRLTDESILAADADIAGRWIRWHRLNRSTLFFLPRPDGRFDVRFATAGCGGGCEFVRIASFANGVIRLDGAIAEYGPRTFDTLHPIRVDGAEYLLPAHGLAEFEEKLRSDGDGWQWYPYRRADKADE
ncbi:MAG: hypothetical protein KJ000_21470 [Pirellulaceae bacterium]|nr:hypothetical protein [Pirellulaceae bacterium]